MLVASLALVLAALLATFPGVARAEQASQPTSPVAGYITTGAFDSCAVHTPAMRCWGYGGDGQLGYGDRKSIGDDETPGSVGPVNLGPGRTAVAISAGNVHTCALLDDGTVRCWGFGADGRLGYGDEQTIGDNEPPGSAGPVNLGPGRTAKAISAGDGHTCAILDNNTVRCWGYGFDGRLGYNNTQSIGDDETPGSAGPVDFGPGLTAKAISAGNAHTCAILSDDTVRCWGFGGAGRLGYGTKSCLPSTPGTAVQCPVDVGRGCWLINNECAPNPNAPSPANMGPVNLGPGRTAKAISAGQFHTCAILDNNTVRCWGTAASGRLGYGNPESIGDNETPDAAGPVDLGPGRTAKAITAGGEHTCAVLDDDSVRCWGFGAFGQLGYASRASIGDDETPRSVGPVDLGPGRTAKAISAGLYHTCARLDDDSVRCWGYGANGRLGYCNELTIGDDETPGSAGPVDLGTAAGGARCPSGVSAPTPAPTPASAGGDTGSAAVDPRAAEVVRARGLQSCQATAKRHARRELRRVRRLSGGRRVRTRRHARRHLRQLRRRCLKRYGRTPGPVTGLTAQVVSSRRIILRFNAAGSDGSRPPAARSYVVKQSRRPIRSARGFRRAPSLCKGRCSFDITRVGAALSLTVTDLRRRAVYYFAVAARDNVSGRTGPRSRALRVRVP